MVDQVAAYMAGHGMVRRGEKVGVAVSGGADSMCLFHALLELRPRWDLELHVLHVNHGLRGEASDADERFVVAASKSWDVPVHVRRVTVPAGENLEQAARTARLTFFREMRQLVDRVATGHTLNDQAETVLFRFLRGTGPSGLTGILPSTADGLIRPLLSVSRAEVEGFLREKGVGWRTDETNRERNFVRNRIRLDLLPLLERVYNPGVIGQLAQTADIAREEEGFWKGYLTRYEVRLVQGAVVLGTDVLAMEGRAVARRLVREAIQQVKGDLREIEYKHVEAALRLATQKEGSGRLQLPGVDVFRSFDRVRIARLGDYARERRAVSMPLGVPGEIHLPEGGVRLRATLVDGYNEDQAETTSCNLLDWDRIEGPLTARYWLPGDGYHPAGSARAQKIKDLFQLHRVPLWERRFWPMVESSQGIVWTRRFGAARFASAGPATARALQIDELSDD
ncbi:MAG: tRNA lysidine(34) synthetase TilS [Bryobacterales bacterium]|nr:tRNA lysidine(34) synthetase TilS [Bryobacterales bacterium]